MTKGKTDDAPLSSDGEGKFVEEDFRQSIGIYAGVLNKRPPAFGKYAGHYDELESKKDAVWESIVAAHSTTAPAQQ